MTKNFEQTKELFTKSLRKMVERKYITINKLVSIDGLSAFLANDLSTFESESIKKADIEHMVDTMQKYYPDLFEKFLGKETNPSK